MPDHQDLEEQMRSKMKQDEAEVCDEMIELRLHDSREALYGGVDCRDYSITNIICYELCRIAAIRKPQSVWKLYEDGLSPRLRQHLVCLAANSGASGGNIGGTARHLE
ncbi:hypothetical protein G7Z17_g7863 [Cylindrodendrum hubeiense]|uniref:Uncharacterized protein n=1 Tax=Cylindrodendrum hubeiense TaxID=595255 RepID=A0A9P5LEX0_9HYPO|nr:hypothetical protein G7Z17_g7863 [Cylindrodendrum hubeiense]